MPNFRPAHEQRRARMILERLLKAKQIPICVGDPPKSLQLEIRLNYQAL
jgi:hypothetical protein